MKYLWKYILPGLFVAIVFVVAYPQRTRPELTVTALWATSSERDPVDGDAHAEGLIPVDFGDGFAYLAHDGRLTYRGRTAAHVALSPAAFVNASRADAPLVVQGADGEFRSSIPAAGYPIFAGDRLFVIADGGGSISEWSIDGDELWRADIAAPLISVDARGDYLALGLGAGGPRIVRRDGTLVEVPPGVTDEEPVIYRVAVSDAPPRLAVVSGAGSSFAGGEPEANTVPLDLSVYDLESGSAVRVFHRRIRSPVDAPPLLRLLSDGRLVVSSSSDRPAIVALDPAGTGEHLIPLRFPGRDVTELVGLPLYAVLSVSSTVDPSRGFGFPAELILLGRDGAVSARTSWAGGATAISQHGSSLTIQVDDRVLAMKLGVR